MTRTTHLTIAALFALLLGVLGLAPARAASLPVGPAIALDDSARPQADSVRYVVRCGPYGCRRFWVAPRPYYGRPVYYGRPAYVRRCFTQRRVVWTPYGYRPRWVRVCR